MSSLRTRFQTTKKLLRTPLESQSQYRNSRSRSRCRSGSKTSVSPLVSVSCVSSPSTSSSDTQLKRGVEAVEEKIKFQCTMNEDFNFEDDDNDDDIEQSRELLQHWIHHRHYDDEKEEDNEFSDLSTPPFFHYLSPQEAEEIRQALLSWYRVHRRKLPWRGDPPPWTTHNSHTNSNSNANTNTNRSNGEDGIVDATSASTPNTTRTTAAIPITAYGVWISEVMLQQTRVETVIPYWLKWMQTFPTLQHLAAASADDVNAVWAGLGYYRRAKFLMDAAAQMMLAHNPPNDARKVKNQSTINDKEEEDDRGSLFPRTVPELMQLPGIGRYTASAIASIVFDECVPVVDGNVARVLARLRGIAQSLKASSSSSSSSSSLSTSRHVWNLAAQIVSAGDGTCAGEVNQALMELGATLCAPAGTGIDPRDPLKEYYLSTRLGRAVQVKMSRILLNGGSGGSSHSGPTLDGIVSQLLDSNGRSCTSASALSLSVSSCPICANDGVVKALTSICATVLTTLESESTTSTTNTKVNDAITSYQLKLKRAAQIAGHQAFPLAAEPKSKREEVWAVAVLSCQRPVGKEEETCWLMTKRPSTGLLASQWEFPSALVWSSVSGKCISNRNRSTKSDNRQTRNDKNESVIPEIAASERSRSIDALLQTLAAGESSSPNYSPRNDSATDTGSSNSIVSLHRIHRSQVDQSSRGPLVHVFSHVRHHLWIEYGVMKNLNDDDIGVACSSTHGRNSKSKSNLNPSDQYNNDINHAQAGGLRWMSRREMSQVGVTSCVKKILLAVEESMARAPIITSTPTLTSICAKKGRRTNQTNPADLTRASTQKRARNKY